MHVDADIAFEKTVFCFDRQCGDIQLQLTGDQVGDLVDDADVIHSHDPDTGKEGDLFILRPFRFDTRWP